VASASAAEAQAAAGVVPPPELLQFDADREWAALVLRFEALLEPLAAMLDAALPPVASPPQASAAASAATAAPAAAATGARPMSALGQTARRASSATAHVAAQMVAPPAAVAATASSQSPLLLLVDLRLAPLPWEALPRLQRACGAAGMSRCLSAAFARHVLWPPTPQPSAAAGASAAAAHPQAPVIDVGRLTYTVDPLFEESDAAAAPLTPGTCAAPLVPAVRERLVPAVAAHGSGTAPPWCAGVVGVPGGIVPSIAEHAAALAGASTLLFLSPGRLLAHVPPAVRAVLLCALYQNSSTCITSNHAPSCKQKQKQKHTNRWSPASTCRGAAPSSRSTASTAPLQPRARHAPTRTSRPNRARSRRRTRPQRC
jgi:hypothetical protein